MIEANCKTPSPFKVNCWKHHAEFIAKQINKIMKEEELETLPAILLKIGGSQMDLYLGKLAPLELTEFIKRFLKKHKVFEYESYKQWLFSEGKEYRLITLQDNSTWTLRMGNQKVNYIHIHPGRYSTHTIRVRALTLKTAVFVMAYLNIYKISSPDLQLINSVRKEFLKAEP
ncbi:MAG: hypothetical protein KJO59_04995, partial [Ignavibacteria bacterium]|nr:hypothetical protein [Ignavibacteria bacterium]